MHLLKIIQTDNRSAENLKFLTYMLCILRYHYILSITELRMYCYFIIHLNIVIIGHTIIFITKKDNILLKTK